MGKINKILDLGQFYQTYAKLCNLFVLLLPLYTRKILLRSGQCDLYWWWKIYWGKIICHGFNHTYFKGYLFPLKKRTNEIRLLIFCSKETFFGPPSIRLSFECKVRARSHPRPISLSRTFLSTLSASSAVEHGVSTKY